MVTFTREDPGTYNASAGTWSGASTTTITGSAVQVKGNAQRYADLGLVLATMPTLFFTPTDYALAAGGTSFVLPGDTVSWCGTTYTVRDVDPIAPDGYVIAARIVVSA